MHDPGKEKLRKRLEKSEAEANAILSRLRMPHNENGHLEPFDYGDDDTKIKFYLRKKERKPGDLIYSAYNLDEIKKGIYPPDLELAPGIPVPNVPPGDGLLREDIAYMDTLAFILHAFKGQQRPDLESADASSAPLQPPQEATAAKAAPDVNQVSIPSVPGTGRLSSAPGHGIRLNENPEVLASNFDVRVLQKQLIRERGREDRTELLIQVRGSGVSEEMTVRSEDVDSLVDTLKRRHPSFIISSSGKTTIDITNYVREQTINAPSVTVVKSAGFTSINGRWVYAHNGADSIPGVVFDTGRTIPVRYGLVDAFSRSMNVLNLSPKAELVVPLLLLAHLRPIFSLFEAAGNPPRFATFLNGTTGSLKTATLLALFRMFAEQPHTVEASFNDTAAALDLKLASAQDRVFVLDDFQPPVSASSGKQKLERLEHVIRLVGDGTGKARGTSSMRKLNKLPAPACSVLITGEDLGGSQSSLLRCLVLPVAKGDFDGGILKAFQDDPCILHSHQYHFLRWCGANADDIIAHIRAEFQREREYFGTFVSEPRLADTGATLALTAQVLLQYATTSGCLNAAQRGEFDARWRQAIAGALAISSRFCKDADPAAMFLQALFDCANMGKLRIAGSQAEYSANTASYSGFAKDGSWWLHDAAVHTEVIRYWSAQGVTFPLKPAKLHELLHSCGLIDIEVEQRGDVAKRNYLKRASFGTRPRMLVLDVERAVQYLADHS